ncbi:SGNH/GDSL hydrolase family protein [Paenibacillus agricola]|uniref:SGNH/GDSL hydrolase family protein n=1 Tax=Paenibacillus agricola TaxID=2716264 RepID=A0ABX0J0S0_9BACL|nr:SGNH/GDSL hydrolase family protein [Paenibacillus agricola]NHN29065.1 SGNH/GDSL hydrolase family protein [Paenibacillus agricola]
MKITYTMLLTISIALFVALCLPSHTFAANDTSTTIHQFYDNPKSGKIIDFVGDSTTESASGLYARISQQYAAPGGPLEGVTVNNRGTNGDTLHNFVSNRSTNYNTLDTVIQDHADLYVLSYGINDIRRGPAQGSSPNQIRADLQKAVDRILNETTGHILLRIPNTFLTKNPLKSEQISPIENAQSYSDQLWNVYQSFEGYSERVDIIDIPSLIFGRVAMPEHRFMQDALHPNSMGYRAIADVIVDRITGEIPLGEWQNKSFAPKTFTVELRQPTQLYNDQKLNWQPTTFLTPQVLTAMKQNSYYETATEAWFQVETWLGNKWVHVDHPIIRYKSWLTNIQPTNSKKATVEITNQTLLYNDAYTDTSTWYVITPQTVEVTDVGNYMYRIKTWVGDKWIPAGATSSPLDYPNGKVANPEDNKIVPIDQVLQLTAPTVLSELPTTVATNKLGALSPQKVKAFEKKGDWYHIHTTWAGDAWLYHDM